MLTHASIWQAIDSLAAEHGLSVSALAKRSGLDPTTFNRSKRLSRDGKPRWPSTESVAKILTATGSTLPDLVKHIADVGDGMRFSGRRIPMIAMAQAGMRGFFDDTGYPVGDGWEDVEFPDIADPHTFAIEISGDAMLPVLRAGDLAVVSPTAGVRRGDRVIVRTTRGEILAMELARRTATRVELHAINPQHRDLEFDSRDIAWISRIIWIGQS
jgi:phage repressor protein C with HTH and peptisase S24 domain